MELCITAIAAERYRLKHGAIPETLDLLVPDYLDEIPVDYYDPKKGPVKIASPYPGEYSIYSIGHNRVDDGGIVVKNESGKSDYLFRVLLEKIIPHSSQDSQ